MQLFWRLLALSGLLALLTFWALLRFEAQSEGRDPIRLLSRQEGMNFDSSKANDKQRIVMGASALNAEFDGDFVVQDGWGDKNVKVRRGPYICNGNLTPICCACISCRL